MPDYLVVNPTKAAVEASGETKASLTTALVGLNNDLVFTAKPEGEDGNEITVEYIDPPGNNVPLSVVVDGEAIKVTLATDGASAITSTSALVEAAVEANAEAAALVTVANSGADTGAGVVTALAATNLAGGVGGAVSAEGQKVLNFPEADIDAWIAADCAVLPPDASYQDRRAIARMIKYERVQ